MSNLNRIILIGRLSSEIELRYTTDGTPMAKFTMAVDRPRRPDGEQKSDFISVIAWNKLAEICAEYLRKGRLTLVEGRIQSRSYDTDDGKRRYVTEVVASTMRMLESLAGTSARPEALMDSAAPARLESVPVAVSSGSRTYSEPLPPSEPVSGDGPFYTEDDIPF